MLIAQAQDLRLYLFAAIFGSMAVGSAAGFLLADYRPGFRFTVSLALVTSLLSVFAIPFFVRTIKLFTDEVKKAYVMLCVGLGIFAVAQIQIPVVNILNAVFWLESGGVATIYVFSAVFVLLAMRKFAKILGVKSVWSSVTLGVAVAISTSLMISFLPHVSTGASELVFDVFQSVTVCNVVFVFFAGMLGLQILPKMSVAYKSAVEWLTVAFYILAFGGLHFLIVRLFLTEADWYLDFSLTIIPFTAGAFAFLIAGYKASLLNVINQPQQSNQVSEIEMVTFLASFASQPSKIESVLDDISSVSAQVKPGEKLSAAQIAVLKNAYLKLQNYLTTSDPIRVYSKQELQGIIKAKFGNKAFDNFNLGAE
ncbi:MAG TPA: hypothetical protein VLA77_03845 [Candidatus Saccharimonadales bacterium]|nr:hypothetical protein [Candidatus Saccharimonadales bacterium]